LQRKNALLKERQKRNRAGGVTDRRFGEDDPDMDPEEKMLERFARERQVHFEMLVGLTGQKRVRNSALFNLEDDVQLTHLGQSLAEMDDFDQNELITVSDDDGTANFGKWLIVGDIKEDVVRQSHFGGKFEDESDREIETNGPERRKTKAEVMQEVISKSKMHKHERQQQHEEDLEEIEALDAELGELQGLLRGIKPSRQEKPSKTQEAVSYDAALREMVYDKRSKPTERTKTDEEVAQEKMEQLQRLEEDRLKRMRGEEMDVDENVNNGRPRREGDDLDDDFVPDEEEEDFYGLGKGALSDESDNGVPAEESEDNEGEHDDNDDDNDEEDNDDDEEDDNDIVEEYDDEDEDFDPAEYFTDEEANGGNGRDEPEEATTIPTTKRLRIIEPSSTTKELAYTFPCPSTFEEMLGILKDVETHSIPTVIERIEILYSTKLLAENREKLEVFAIDT
jgi:nucleolar protein 14